jgi:hypothetical protein
MGRWQDWKRGPRDGIIRCLPPIRAEQQVDYMVVHVKLTFEIRVDHLANRRGTVFGPPRQSWKPCQHIMSIIAVNLTKAQNMAACLSLSLCSAAIPTAFSPVTSQ